jgi:hypothetical protein
MTITIDSIQDNVPSAVPMPDADVDEILDLDLDGVGSWRRCEVATPRGDPSLYCFLRRERSTYFQYTLGVSTSFCHQILEFSITSKNLN